MSTLKGRSARGKKRIRGGRKPTPQLPQQRDGDRLLTGAQAIANELDWPLQRTFDWLKHRRINCAKKSGDLWVAGRNALRREFGLDTV
jgi:hypothetical protein